MTTRRRSVCVTAVLCTVLGGMGSTQGSASGLEGRYVSVPDTIVAAPDMRVDVERGLFFARENRADPDSRVIAIHFLRFPAAHSEKPGPPVFLLPGGPGSDISFENVSTYYSLPMVERLRRTRDVIYVSQRGNPVAPGLQPELREKSTAANERAAFKEAVQYWTARGVDLRGYDILNIVDDVYELRSALGYNKIVLRGCSFGSQWSLSYIKRWPQTVDRALLSGIEPLDHTYDSPKWLWASLTRLAKRAEADANLSREIPKAGLMRTLQALIERLERQPETVTIRDPRTGQPVPVTVGADDVRVLIADRGAFGKTPGESLGNWPRFLLEMSRGDFRFLAAKRWDARRAQRAGLPLIGPLIDNSLGISAARDALLLAEPEARWLGDINARYRATLDLTPTPRVNDAFRADWPIDMPVLLLHGDLDWSTPIENARHLRRHLAQGHLIEVEGGTHCDESPVMADTRPREMDQIYGFIEADFTVSSPEAYFATLPKSVAYPPVRFASLSGPSLYEQWLAR